MQVRDALLAKNGRSRGRRPRAPSTAAILATAGLDAPLAEAVRSLQRGAGNHAVARLLEARPVAPLPMRTEGAVLQRARGGRDDDRRRDRERTQQRARQRAGKRERAEDPYPFGAEASAAAPAQTPLPPGFKDYKDRSGEFFDAMAEARAAKDASRQPWPVMRANTDALRDYREQQTHALKAFAASRQAPVAAPARPRRPPCRARRPPCRPRRPPCRSRRSPCQPRPPPRRPRPWRR